MKFLQVTAVEKHNNHGTGKAEFRNSTRMLNPRHIKSIEPFGNPQSGDPVKSRINMAGDGIVLVEETVETLSDLMESINE